MSGLDELPHRPGADDTGAAGHEDASGGAHRDVHCPAGEGVRRPLEPEVLAQRCAAVFGLKDAAALKLGHDPVEEEIERAGMVGEGDFEAVGGLAATHFDVVGDRLRRASDRTPAQHEADQLTDGQLLAAGLVDEELLDGLRPELRLGDVGQRSSIGKSQRSRSIMAESSSRPTSWSTSASISNVAAAASSVRRPPASARAGSSSPRAAAEVGGHRLHLPVERLRPLEVRLKAEHEVGVACGEGATDRGGPGLSDHRVALGSGGC